MSRPDRPFRATRVLANRTVHHDYATKEERDAATCTEDKRTTVTSRKPVKPGTPVCWVNVYEDSDGKRAGGFTYRTEGAAALSAGSAAIHCIPVYLPGEGAEPACTSECDTLRAEVQDWASRFKQAQQEVERLTNLAQDWATTARVRAEERDVAKAEVERLTKELGEARAEFDELSRRHGIAVDRAQFAEAQRDADRVTKERDAAKELTDDRIKEHRNQAFAAGQRMALADVRRALGIKEES